MKKFLPYIIIAVVVLGGAATYLLLKQGSTKNEQDNSVAAQTDSQTPAKKYSDACKVFTKEDLAAALGGAYGEGEEEYAASSVSPGSPDYDELKGSACAFKQDNDGTTAGMTQALDFSITINNYKDASAATAFMSDLHDPQTAEGKAAMKTPVDVSGVGEQAFFAKPAVADTVEDKNESLYVRLGKQVIVLNATKLAGVDHDAVQAGLTTLAKKL